MEQILFFRLISTKIFFSFLAATSDRKI